MCVFVCMEGYASVFVSAPLTCFFVCLGFDQCAASTTTIAHRSYLAPRETCGAQDVFDSGSLVTTSLNPIGRRDSREDVRGEKKTFISDCSRMLQENPLRTGGTWRQPLATVQSGDGPGDCWIPAGRKQPSCYRPPHDVGGRSSPRAAPNNLATSGRHR
jgi:hypothetical protein